MSVLITNIGELVTNRPGEQAVSAAVTTVAGAALVIDEGLVAWTGPASRAPAADQMVDAGGRAVLPGFVTVTDCAPLVEPTAWFPNETLDGDAASGLPVPPPPEPGKTSNSES